MCWSAVLRTQVQGWRDTTQAVCAFLLTHCDAHPYLRAHGAQCAAHAGAGVAYHHASGLCVPFHTVRCTSTHTVLLLIPNAIPVSTHCDAHSGAGVVYHHAKPALLSLSHTMMRIHTHCDAHAGAGVVAHCFVTLLGCAGLLCCPRRCWGGVSPCRADKPRKGSSGAGLQLGRPAGADCHVHAGSRCQFAGAARHPAHTAAGRVRRVEGTVPSNGWACRPRGWVHFSMWIGGWCTFKL